MTTLGFYQNAYESVSRGSENQVEPPSPRGRKLVKNAEMLKTSRRCYQRSDKKGGGRATPGCLFRVYIVTCLFFLLLFKETIGFGKTEQKPNKQKVALVMLERGPFPVVSLAPCGRFAQSPAGQPAPAPGSGASAPHGPQMVSEIRELLCIRGASDVLRGRRLA